MEADVFMWLRIHNDYMNELKSLLHIRDRIESFYEKNKENFDTIEDFEKDLDKNIDKTRFYFSVAEEKLSEFKKTKV